MSHPEHAVDVPRPPDEPERLRRLASLDILDTGPERSFDDIVDLAAAICGTPVALITFVDGERQWFKARHGWHVSETPRSVSFCAHAILGDEPLVVEDATLDDRFADNPLVLGEPYIRSYVGFPLRVGHGSGLGTLCAIGHEPNRPSDRELAGLGILARQVEQMLQTRLLEADHRQTLEAAAALRERWRTVTDSMLCGVVVHAADGAIESVNPAAEAMLGMSFDQMSGRTPLDPTWQCVHADGSPFPGHEHPASVTLRECVEVRDEVMGIRHPDGTTRWIIVTSSPVIGHDGRAEGAVATFVDISREVELRDQLAESLGLLTDTIREHASLAAAITHDLAAPAAATRIYADLLADVDTGAASLNPDERDRVIAAIRQNAHRTEQLVSDLGSVASRLRLAEPPRRAETDVLALVRRVCALSPHPVEVVADDRRALGTHTAEVDVIQIERLVDNLVGNAAKHAPSSNPIVVGVAGGAEWILITVDDDGPGIAADDRERVFEPFRRLDPAGVPGTGVGLYLVREFARFHGGDAWCETSPTGGSRFVVTLARRPAASTRPG